MSLVEPAIVAGALAALGLAYIKGGAAPFPMLKNPAGVVFPGATRRRLLGFLDSFFFSFFGLR
jgi:hypothetical protein